MENLSIKRKKKNIKQLTFRINLARQLIASNSSKKRRYKSIAYLGNKGEVPTEVRLQNVGKHLPSKQNTYRRCRLCSTKKAEKRTKYVCTEASAESISINETCIHFLYSRHTNVHLSFNIISII